MLAPAFQSFLWHDGPDVGDNKKGVGAYLSRRMKKSHAPGSTHPFVLASITMLFTKHVIKDVLLVHQNRFGQRKD